MVLIEFLKNYIKVLETYKILSLWKSRKDFFQSDWIYSKNIFKLKKNNLIKLLLERWMFIVLMKTMLTNLAEK